jgi:site-specific DNA-cytosine methylase
MMMEGYSFKALGMQVHTVLACEPKRAAARWINRNMSTSHFYPCLADAASRTSCLKCGGSCSLAAASGKIHLDMVVGGLPCKPFTRMRDRRCVKAEAHPAYAVQDDFFALLASDSFQIDGFIIEEVLGMSELSPEGSDFTFLELFIQKAQALGYAVRALSVCSSLWVAMPRPRLQRCTSKSVLRNIGA